MNTTLTTPIQHDEKILAYDGDCPICLRTVAMLIDRGLVAPGQARANHDLSPEDLATAQAAGIRNQLVVFDPHTRETRAGVDALLWIIGANRGHPWWVRLLSLPGVRHLLGTAYEVISYNRRVISPPAHRIRCDCEPQVTVVRRLALIVPLVALSALALGLFGAAVSHGAGLSDPIVGALALLAAAGAVWLALLATAIVLLRGEQRIDVIAHLAVVTFVGAMLLVPAGALAWWLPRDAALAIAALSALVSAALMVRMLSKRAPLVR